MRIQDLKEKVFNNGWPTPMGWAVLTVFVFGYLFLKHQTTERRKTQAALELENKPKKISRKVEKLESTTLPVVPLPQRPVSQKTSVEPIKESRQYNQPSFGNLNSSPKATISDDFLPKGTILYATLTSDIVSNNQLSPATATIIYPSIFAHKVRIPVGTKLTGKIAPGNLRGRVFVSWDTLIFYDEGRQGFELPIKGVGMTYEQNSNSGRWIINGAGLKGFIFDDSTSAAFKLAALRAFEDFAKTLQTFVTTQNSTVAGGSVITSTTTTPEATLQNSGLAFTSSFIDVIAQRYQAQLTQQNSFVLVPTARMCAVFLDEAIDISTASPGRSISNIASK